MFKIGVYQKEITPPLGSDIPGYFEHRYSDGILDRLYVRAVAIEAAGEVAIVISADAINIHQSMHDIAVAQIEKFTGVSSDRVLINATHAHTGGPVGKDDPDPEYFDNDVEYENVVSKLIGDCGVMAYRSMVPAEIKIAETEVKTVSFIRNYYMKDGSIRTNPGFLNPEIDRPYGKIDYTFNAMFFYGEGEKPFGAITCFSDHCDCVHGTKYSGDYVGVCEAELKKEYGNDFVMVYMNAPCGNINCFDVNKSLEENLKPDRHIEIGKILAQTAIKIEKTAKPMTNEVINGKKEFIPIDRRKLPEEEIKELKKLVEDVSLEGLSFNLNTPESPAYKRALAERLLVFSELPDKLLCSVQALKIGDCMLFAMCGECYADFAIGIKEKSPASFNMVASLANGGPYGYIPIPELFEYPIYEVQVPTSKLIPQAGWIMVDRMAELAEEISK